jgi:2-polyprenyl-3-methyl-5-hydroxy-6-metoxy-1,4-benzoquinol methylase
MQSAAIPVRETRDKASRAIEYLSPPAPVRMAEQWFEIALLDHFWVRRRFTVFQRLARRRVSTARELAEVGCGHGLLQRQIEDAYGREVWGFDLNECALKQNVSRRSKLCCYDIFQRDAGLLGRFDLLFLFDVLEHISDESAFLQALLSHLSPAGSLVVNVPAGQWAYSSYDKAAGHVRRYSIHTLKKVMAANGLALREWSYWGLPLMPALFLRKFWLMGRHEENEIITAGFDSRSSAVNTMMGFLSALEWVPQRFLGTSLMAIFERSDQAALSSPGKATGA